MKKNKIIVLKIIVSVLALFALIIGAFLIYASNYYHTDEIALEAASIEGSVKIDNSSGALIFDPGDADTALVFYPGGKVEYTAYEPLMIKIAKNGILCILPKMPLNLAVFNLNAADTYISSYPNIKHWYLGGHSLGGSMAASYVANNSEKVEGLVLLASYSTANLSETGIAVLSIYGSNDNVLNEESYEANKSNLPPKFTEIVLDGGNHAGFGCYGKQKGDGEASIAPEQQQTDTADSVAQFIFSDN